MYYSFHGNYRQYDWIVWDHDKFYKCEPKYFLHYYCNDANVRKVYTQYSEMVNVWFVYLKILLLDLYLLGKILLESYVQN